MKYSAYDEGRMFARSLTRQYATEDLGDLIFKAMEINPYKSVESRAKYLQGVSDTVNDVAATRWHKQVHEVQKEN